MDGATAVGAGLLPNEHRKPQRHGQPCFVHVKLWLVSEAFRIQYEIGKGPRGIGSSRAFFHVVPVYHNAGSEQLPRPSSVLTVQKLASSRLLRDLKAAARLLKQP